MELKHWQAGVINRILAWLQSHHYGIETFNVWRLGTYPDLLQSHHYGIETWFDAADQVAAFGLQSHHYGIETALRPLRLHSLQMLQSHHYGIETNEEIAILKDEIKAPIAPLWN